MALRPHVINKRSPFLGEACALCKEPFAPGEELVICPADATRHHVHCWRANGDRCTAYGCEGRGEIDTSPERPRVIEQGPESEPAQTRRARRGRRPEPEVRTLPSSSFGCSQGCLIMAIAAAILFFSIGCFGLWAIADYLMEMMGWNYREPLGSLLPAVVVQVRLAAGSFFI